MDTGKMRIAGPTAGGTGQALSLGRRAVLFGLAAMPSVAVSPHREGIEDLKFEDQVILYLQESIEAAGRELQQGYDESRIAVFKRMTTLASAMAVMPGSNPRASSAKRQVAAWRVETEAGELRLPFQVTSELRASAARDERP